MKQRACVLLALMGPIVFLFHLQCSETQQSIQLVNPALQAFVFGNPINLKKYEPIFSPCMSVSARIDRFAAKTTMMSLRGQHSTLTMEAPLMCHYFIYSKFINEGPIKFFRFVSTLKSVINVMHE